MPRLRGVVLSKDVEPKFPDRCVASGKDRPGFATWVIARDASKGANLLDGWFAVRVPCCQGRRWSLHVRRLLGSFFTLFFVAVGSILGVLIGAPFVFRHLGRPEPTIEWIGAGAFAVSVVCSVGLYLWAKRFPTWFTLEISEDSVEYQFLSESYAEEFSRLNTDVPGQKGVVALLSEDQIISLQSGSKLVLRSANGSDQEIAYSVILVKGMEGQPNPSLQPTAASSTAPSDQVAAGRGG